MAYGEDGFIQFHFSDISQHADRVRDKILQSEKETLNMSPGRSISVA